VDIDYTNPVTLQICAVVHPSEIKSMCNDEDVANGFVPRFIMLVVILNHPFFFFFIAGSSKLTLYTIFCIGLRVTAMC
jgi:hypothetical protein